MVWYGKVWDEKAGDWTYEDDNSPPPKPKTKAELAAERAEQERNAAEAARFRCKALYGQANHRAGQWRENSGYAWCAHCGYRYERHHTMVGVAVVGTGGEVTNTGHACAGCPEVHVVPS